jgi:hypothetical protein
MPVGWGVTLSGALQSNESPDSSRTMIFSRLTRYPATCPAPCPAGERIFPTLTASSLTVALDDSKATRVERITQLDLKAQKTFRLGRVSVSPHVEVFNINNSDAIISYRSTNVLNAVFLQPNSIMQGRMVGVGAQVRW